MKKLFLILLLSLVLTTTSSAGYLDYSSGNPLCGWMDNPSPPSHIVAEVNMKGLYCDDDIAIKTVKTPVVKGSILLSKLKRWTKMSKGGHFAALEQPDLLIKDIREFAKTLR